MKKTILILAFCSTLFSSLALPAVCFAQPYGKGVYGANVPYGNLTSLSIATSGNISIPITPTTSGTLATGNSVVTVTSTDVMGYKLYIRALNDTNMNNLGALLPTSGNATPASLAINTWGYNTDASNNFVGMTLSDILIRAVGTPVSAGDVTTVTYGINIDLAKPAGNYVTSIVYTAVPQTD